MRKPALIFALVFTLFVKAQELNCVVQCISPTALTSAGDKEILSDLQKSVFEFMNNTKWTNDVFDINERIDCNIMINITEKVSSDEFKGTIQVQSSRVVYNTSYKSTILNFNDNDFHIKYLRNTVIEFTPDQHKSNLASILAYYAYMIIALDYDSFSLYGGTTHFNKAQQVVTNAANAPEPGWQAFGDDRNRYWLVSNYLNAMWNPLREAIYTYHRKGFDIMYDDMVKGRQQVIQALELIRKVHQKRQGTFNVQLFFTAKSDELVSLFSEANSSEKTQAYNLLKEIDPANLTKYNKIIENN